MGGRERRNPSKHNDLKRGLIDCNDHSTQLACEHIRDLCCENTDSNQTVQEDLETKHDEISESTRWATSHKNAKKATTKSDARESYSL